MVRSIGSSLKCGIEECPHIEYNFSHTKQEDDSPGKTRNFFRKRQYLPGLSLKLPGTLENISLTRNFRKNVKIRVNKQFPLNFTLRCKNRHSKISLCLNVPNEKKRYRKRNNNVIFTISRCAQPLSALHFSFY